MRETGSQTGVERFRFPSTRAWFSSPYGRLPAGAAASGGVASVDRGTLNQAA